MSLAKSLAARLTKRNVSGMGAEVAPRTGASAVTMALAASLAAPGILAGSVRPASAQGYTPIYSIDYGNPVVVGEGGEATTVRKPRPKYSLATAIFPMVGFNRSGYFSDRQSGGTDLVVGQIVAADGSIVSGRTNDPSFDFGGWYFVQNPSLSGANLKSSYDLYELHVRAFTTSRRDFGIQAAVLRSTNVDFPGNEYTLFFVTDYSSARIRHRSKPNWGVEAGAGFLIDPSYDPNYFGKRTTYDPTFFLSGSIDLGSRYNMTLSEWYARDRTQDINRLALGFGYHF